MYMYPAPCLWWELKVAPYRPTDQPRVHPTLVVTADSDGSCGGRIVQQHIKLFHTLVVGHPTLLQEQVARANVGESRYLRKVECLDLKTIKL